MKRTLWFIGLLGLLVGFGILVSWLQEPDDEESARLIGALGFIEQQIERSSQDILDANPFISPTIDSSSSANTFRVAGRVRLLSRDADSGLERAHVEPYHAVVESLCKPYANKTCWRLRALTVASASAAENGGASKTASAGEDAEPIEAPRAESEPNEAPEAEGTSAVAITMPIETPKAEPPSTAESDRPPHESEFSTALPSRLVEWPFGNVPFASSPSAGPSSAGLVADTALPAAPEPPQPAGTERVQRPAQQSTSPRARAAHDRHLPSESQVKHLAEAPEPAARPGEPSHVREIVKSTARLARRADSGAAAAVALSERPGQEPAAGQESPFATMSAAARQAEGRRVAVETFARYSIMSADGPSDETGPAIAAAAVPRQVAQRSVATEAPQDSAAEPDTASASFPPASFPPVSFPPVSFPEVASDRLVARADDRQTPAETRRAVTSVDRAPAVTEGQTPSASPEPDRSAIVEPESATPTVTAAAKSPEPQRTAEPPLTEAERRELEEGLARLGFYPGPIDGALDGQSEEAIRAYQDFAALPDSGRPDRALLAEVRQLVETVTLLANDRDRMPVQHGGADTRTAAAGETSRSATDAQPKLADVSRPVPTVSVQPLPVAPPRKPERASPPAGQPSLAENRQQAAPKTVASLKARPLPDKPVAGKPELPRPRPTTVAFTVDSLPKEVRRAIQAGTLDVHLDNGHTPLTAAIVDGRQDAVAALLDHGANPDLSTEDDATALMYAAWAGDVESVRLLLQAEAEPNHKNLDGKTALMAAAATGQAKIAELLLKAGADPDLQALKGWTALMYAVWRDKPEVVRLLLKHRANILLRNNDDETAVDIAAERERANIHALLVSASGSS